jgi:photosystem II stability/assembly factor-like uncharacterized protein
MDRISCTIKRFLPVAVASAALLFVSDASAQTPTTIAPPPVSVGHSGWYWGNPAPQGQNLSAVAFQGTTGYAVGALGTVVRSEDGGQTWTGLASGTVDDLDLVQELTPTTVITGGGCSVLESTDSGQSFTSLPLGLAGACSDTVAGIAFSSAEQGYIVLRDGTLLYTADGGRTVEARSNVPTGGSTVAGLAFSSPTEGVAVTVSGLIEQTTDGGNSWNQVSSGRELAGITIVSPTLAFAVGPDGVLLRSTDGGATWTALPLALTGNAIPPSLTSITCSNATNCLITTANSNQLVRTTDGGMTGTIVSVSDSALSGVAFTGADSVVGVGQQGATVASSDAGQTFPVVSSPALPNFVPGGELVAGRMAGTAYQTGGQGTIAATTDSGAAWTELRVPTNSAILSIAFPSTRTGYALDAAGTLRRTVDGGSSWSSFAQTYPAGAELVAPSAHTLLLAGPRGVRRSTNAGSTFRSVTGRVRVRHGKGPAVTSLRLRGARASGSIAWAWGPSGLILSTDTGRVWRRVTLPFPGSQIQSVSVISATRVWALRSDRRLYETTDGGRRWVRNLAVGALTANGTVSFGSAQDGMLTVSGSTQQAPFRQVGVLSTRNGGRTWEPQIVDGLSPNELLATPSVDYFTGMYGDPMSLGLLATTNGGASPLASSLSISVAHRRLTPAALKRAAHSLLVRGRVHPVLADDEDVLVSYTVGNGWRTTTALVATSGAFQVRLRGIRASTEIVAQAIGDGRHGGAGTPVLRVTVRR